MDSSTLTPFARALGRRLRAGYALVFFAFFALSVGAAIKIHTVLGLDAQHAGMINGAGRERLMALQTMHRALVASQHPSAANIDAVSKALSAWSAQQAWVESKLGELGADSDPLRQEFSRLKERHYAIELLIANLIPIDATGSLEPAQIVEVATNNYIESTDLWIAAFAERLSTDTEVQQRRILLWATLLLLTAASLSVAVLEPIIRRLQLERSTFERTARERAKMAGFADTTYLSVLVADLEGRIDWTNQGFSRLTGYSASQAIGKSLPELLHGEETGEVAADQIIAALRTRTGFEAEVRHYRSDGSSYWGALDWRPMPDDLGHIVAYLAVESNITARKNAEQGLREAAVTLMQAKEAAEAANVAKSEFLANMSHEIRTPLNGVIGMTGLLMDTALNGEQRQYTEIARSSGEALLSLINNILDLSKIEAGHLELESVDFELRTLIDDTVDAVALTASAKGLEVLVDVDPTCPEFLRGDPTRLRQVLLNLMSNAVKFTETGDVTLSVQTAPSHSNLYTLIISVTDQGIGISPEVQEKLFRPFTQADTSTRRQHGGTGLGLSICRRLVEAMGGNIALQSSREGGSTFWFQIGLLRAVRECSSNPASSVQYRVLVVSGHARLGQLLSAQLRGWGATPRCVPDVQVALHCWQAMDAEGNAPAAILIDHRLGELEARWLADQLRSFDIAERTRRILMTSLIPASTHLDFDAFHHTLKKPLKPSALRQLVVDLVVAPRAGAAPVPVARGALQGRRALLVDDNAVNQKLGERLLQRLGITVAQAWNGEEALQRLRHDDFDVVLMDCQMPVMDGYEATRALRKTGSGVLRPEIPVIAVTANAIAGDRERCLAAGMNDYLTKPLDSARLSAVLETVIGSSLDAGIGADRVGRRTIK